MLFVNQDSGKKDREEDSNYVSMSWKNIPHIWCMRDKGVPEREECVRVVKDVCHQCEIVRRCATGSSEPFIVEEGLQQGSAFSIDQFASIIDALTENIRKEAPWQMVSADDVVLRAMEADVLHGGRTGAVEGSLEEERNERT